MMDIVGGLAAANQAMNLVKELREIDRSVDEAGFKATIAELTLALADAKVALSEAKLSLNERDDEVRSLRSQLDLATNGDVCPKCRTGRLSLTHSEGMMMGGLGRYGVEEWEFTCGNSECDFRTTKVQDPQGLVQKFISKR